MGGSLALAARSRADVDEVVGFDSDPAALEEALQQGRHHRGCRERGRGGRLRRPGGSLDSGAEHPRPGGGVRCSRPAPASDHRHGQHQVGHHAQPVSGSARSLFIGGHPMCGAADSGVRYARADLFEGATYFLCTTGAAFPKLYAMLQQFVVDLGARPTHIDAEAHDRIMAVISHLPHVLANALMEHAGELQRRRQAGSAVGGRELHRPHSRGRRQSAHVAGHLPGEQ